MDDSIKPPANTLKLTSSAFANNASIPITFTCKGSNTSPPLEITGTPDGTSSLALIMHDPDAVGNDFTHWVVWNIAPGTSTITQSKLPTKTKEGLNDAGRPGYFGPCPPAGTGAHRYQFELFALDTSLQGGHQIKRADLEAMMSGHILDHTVLTG